MPMKAKSIKHSDSAAYMAMIQRLPLKPIRNDKEHQQAVEIIKEYLGREMDSGTNDYLDTLILLANKYEDEHHTRAPRP